jgi:hypothetical protein
MRRLHSLEAISFHVELLLALIHPELAQDSLSLRQIRDHLRQFQVPFSLR